MIPILTEAIAEVNIAIHWWISTSYSIKQVNNCSIIFCDYFLVTSIAKSLMSDTTTLKCLHEDVSVSVLILIQTV